MLEYWIWLASRTNISERKKLLLLDSFESPENVWSASAEELKQFSGLSDSALESLLTHDLSEAEKTIDVCLRTGIRMLTLADADYPQRLSQIYDPPIMLFCKGELPDVDGLPTIGIVGTRKPSAYGMNTARRLGEEITQCGGLVVSGMAGGIDSAAMAGALQAGGSVIGVLGCGVDVIYPKSSKALYQDTCRFGCLVSEYVPGTQPLKWNFPRRNRIISGLSCGVVVVEAPEKSGSIITARCALEQGRDVFAVPGNVDMDSFVGSNRLLREGAGAVSSGWDILCEYQPHFPNLLSAGGDKSSRSASGRSAGTNGKTASSGHADRLSKPDAAPCVEKIVIDKQKTQAYSGLNSELQTLTSEEKAIVDTLSRGERLTDDVLAESGLPAGKALAALTMMEIKGIVRRCPGKRVALTGRYQ